MNLRLRVLLLQRPEVLSRGFLADYTAMHQLFVFFLPAMCSPGAQQLLFNAMTTPAHTKRKQLKVMGYSIEDEVICHAPNLLNEHGITTDVPSLPYVL